MCYAIPVCAARIVVRVRETDGCETRDGERTIERDGGARERKREDTRATRWEETRRRRGARTHKSRGWQRMTLRVVNL